MYHYDSIDRQLVSERAAQFRDQVERWKSGELTNDEFRPLRLQNGLYVQRHAPMLRIAVPYGMLSSTQLRKLAFIARTYDRGYGHFTTRHNMQFNWPRIEDVSGHPRPTSPKSRCTPSRPPATASATSPPTSSPASPPTR